MVKYKQTVIRRPKLNLTIVTERNKFEIVHDTRYPDNEYATESIVSMTTQNSMGNDSAAFSIVLAGDTAWENLITENDLVILRVLPNEATPNDPNRKDKVNNDIIMVGLVSEVRIEGTYNDDRKLYRITGQSFQKAFMQFELRVIQQVSLTMPNVGWMDADMNAAPSASTGGGVTGGNASGITTNSPMPPVDGGQVTSRFGQRADPATGATVNHNGLDIGLPTGTPIKSMMGGVVARSGYDSGGAGTYAIVKQTDGYYAQYFHMNSLAVSQGQTVRRGQTLGTVGSTGYSTGPHLHLGLASTPWGGNDGGTYYNPESYLGGSLGSIGTASGSTTSSPMGAFTSTLMGKSVKDVIGIMLKRFTEYMEYDFDGATQTTFQDRFEVNLDSWTKDENLINPLVYTAFEGSFNQLLMDILSQPFNELFFDFFKGDKGIEKTLMTVRRTPFDEADWKATNRHVITADQVVTENISQSDLDAFALYNVIPEDLSDSVALMNARPYFNREMVKKYGYKMLEVSHKFLGFKATVAQTDGASTTNQSYGSGQEKEAFNQITRQKGLSQAEKDAWAWIIDHESSWNMNAVNPSSGAIGLGQLNPAGGHTIPEGYRGNAYNQLEWMWNYMKERYGGSVQAKAFWQANNWY